MKTWKWWQLDKKKKKKISCLWGGPPEVWGGLLVGTVQLHVIIVNWFTEISLKISGARQHTLLSNHMQSKGRGGGARNVFRVLWMLYKQQTSEHHTETYLTFMWLPRLPYVCSHTGQISTSWISRGWLEFRFEFQINNKYLFSISMS